MCTISEQFLTNYWVDNYDGSLDDEYDDDNNCDDDDDDNDNDNSDEDDDDNDNDNSDEDAEWLFDPVDSKYLNRRVRINFDYNFFQEGRIIGNNIIIIVIIVGL